MPAINVAVRGERQETCMQCWRWWSASRNQMGARDWSLHSYTFHSSLFSSNASFLLVFFYLLLFFHQLLLLIIIIHSHRTTLCITCHVDAFDTKGKLLLVLLWSCRTAFRSNICTAETAGKAVWVLLFSVTGRFLWLWWSKSLNILFQGSFVCIKQQVALEIVLNLESFFETKWVKY